MLVEEKGVGIAVVIAMVVISAVAATVTIVNYHRITQVIGDTKSQTLIHNYISWSVFRPDPNHLTFSYQDNDNGTISARLLIYDTDNGALFYDGNFASNSFTTTLPGAEGTHFYYIDLAVSHRDFGTFFETQTLGISENYYHLPSPPNGVI